MEQTSLIATIILLSVLLLLAISLIARLGYKAWRTRRIKGRRTVTFDSTASRDGSYMPVTQADLSTPASLRLPSTSDSPFSSGEVRHVRVQPLLIRRSVPDSPDSAQTTPKTPLAKDLGSLDPNLYTFETQEEEDGDVFFSGGNHKLGQVHFTVQYDIRRTVLTVRLIKAINLSPLDGEWSKPCNPFAIVQLQPDYQHQLQSYVQRKTTNPNFDETFEFEVLVQELQRLSLCITLHSFDTFASHDIIGQALLPLADLDLNKENIYITDLRPSLKHVDLGELMVSLGYLKSAERLTVVLIKARNLPAVNIKGTDPYVKVSLLINGKRVKKKKTSTKKSDLHPVFNEAVSFDISKELLSNIDLLLSVMHDNDVIGSFLIGAHAQGKQHEHWQDVLTADRPIAHWHILQDPKKF